MIGLLQALPTALHAVALIGLSARGLALALPALTVLLMAFVAHGLLYMTGRISLTRASWQATELIFLALEVAVVLELGHAILGTHRKARRTFWLFVCGVAMGFAALSDWRLADHSLAIAAISNGYRAVLVLLIITLVTARIFAIPICRLNSALLVGLAAPMVLREVVLRLRPYNYEWPRELTGSVMQAGGIASAFIWAVAVWTAPPEKRSG